MHVDFTFFLEDLGIVENRDAKFIVDVNGCVKSQD